MGTAYLFTDEIEMAIRAIADHPDVDIVYHDYEIELVEPADSAFDDAGDPPGVGQLLIAVAPGAFGGADRTERFARLGAMIVGDGDARLPGRRRQELRQKAREHGIDADADLVARIEAIAAA